MREHGPVVLLFAGLTLLWTWPLAAHLGTRVPGAPGDNFSFLWMLWWARRTLHDPALHFLHTDYLFFPFGTSLVNHSHTALPAFVAGTLLYRLPIATAQNIIVLAHVLANGLAAYALAWDLTRHRRAAVCAGILFGTCPYLASHVLGHFELVAAWMLPAFALAYRHALQRRSDRAALAGAVVISAAAYIAYYYVVYLALFAVTYGAAASLSIQLRAEPRRRTPLVRRARAVVAAALAATLLLTAWIFTTGGTVWSAGAFEVSLRGVHNPLTAAWLLTVAAVWLRRRLRLRVGVSDPLIVRRAVRSLALVAAVFVPATAPLWIEAAQVIRSGAYVTQPYFWRSAPAGIDLLAPLLGNPYQTFMRPVSRRLYELAGSDPVEAVAWIGIVPCMLLCWLRVGTDDRREAARWWAVVGVFALWALGPNLMVAGHDVGLPLPQSLIRFLPLVNNARMPGRAMVVVYLGVAALIALRLAAIGAAPGRSRTPAAAWLRRPAIQWGVAALIGFEYLDVPLTLTPLPASEPFLALASQPAGAVCSVPFVIGDGLGRIGPYDLSVLYEATIHEHPLAGGFLSRLPAGAVGRYASMRVAGTLLRLSAERPSEVPESGPEEPSPCTYLVVKDALAGPALMAYVRSLPIDSIASANGVRVFRVRVRTMLHSPGEVR